MKTRNVFTVFLIVLCVFSLSAKEKLHLKIGTYENSPKIFTDDNDEISGFWADITKEIAKRENWEIEWVHGTWDQCLQRLENKEIDIMVDVGLTPARQKRFAFSNEILLLSWTRLYTQEGTELQSILDLNGKKIAGLKGSFNIEGPEGLKDIVDKFNINCKIIEMDDYIKVFEALDKKIIYAGITNKDFGDKHEQDYRVERTSIIFQPARMQFAFTRDSELTPHLIDKIDQQIIKLKNDTNSIYYNSMEKYLGEQEKITVFPLWIKITIAIILTFVIIFWIFILILKNQVKHRTQELEQDITKLKQAEEEITKLSKIVETTCQLVVLTTIDGSVVYVNQAYLDISGFIESEVIGSSMFDFTAEEGMKILKEETIPQLLSSGHWQGEMIVRIKDGTKFPADLICSLIKNKNDEPEYFVAVFNDITERKLVVEQIKTSEEKYRVITENAKHIIITHDLDGKITYANNFALEYMNITKEEVIGQSIAEFIHSREDMDAMKQRQHDFITGKNNIHHYELNVKNLSGEYRILEVYGNPIIDSNNNITAVLIIAYDITERKKTENALRESEARFKALHNASFGGITIHDKGLILDCNKGLAEITGYTVDELVGMDGLLLIAEESREIVMENILAGYEEPYEAIGIRKNGEKYPLRLEARQIPYKGKEVRVVEFRDITESKKIEEEIKQRMKELEIFNDAAVDRELVINDLRKEVNEMLEKMGKKKKYDIVT